METGHAKKGKRRLSSNREAPAFPHWRTVLLPVIGLALPRLGNERGGRAANFEKIPNNSIKFDKFTGFSIKNESGKSL